MKSYQIILVLFGFIILALMSTNPSIEDHRQAVLEELKDKMKLSSNSISENPLEKAGEMIGLAIVEGVIKKAVIRDNFLLFSFTKISFAENHKNIGFGIFGKVYVFEYDEIDKVIESDRNQSLIESKTNTQLEWVGSYNNYDPSLPIYTGYGFCNPGSEDIEIRIADSKLLVSTTSSGMRMGVTYTVKNEYRVIEVNNSSLVFESLDDTNGIIFRYKLTKIGDKYFVKNLSQTDCKDYQIIKVS